jgi:hypothetical protein
MASKKFSEILAQGARQGFLPQKNRASRDWFKSKVQNINFSSHHTYDEGDTYLFDAALADGIRDKIKPGRNPEAREYFRKKGLELGKPNFDTLSSDRARLLNEPTVGNMYFFQYDPLHKDTLPFYDRFPLIFMVGPAPGGFYGINFHYLNHPIRAKLMDALYSIRTNSKFDSSTIIELSYDVLKTTPKLKWFKPAFKHYLSDHVDSKFIYIPAVEWDIALFLDVAKFEKASEAQVWADSNRRLNVGTKRKARR